MTIFYVKGVDQGVRQLDEDESRHCFQVLRHVSGDEIFVFDGNGGRNRAILKEVSKKSCTFDIITSEMEPARNFSIHLAIAPTKNADRMEWLVEKLAEIGVGELSLIETDHSERRKLRTDRLEKKAVSAMKQSGNPFLLKINALTNFKDFITADDADQKFIAHVDPEHPYLAEKASASSSVSLLVGPEGDFSKKEVEAAIGAGYLPASLGKNTLRTETAGFVACCIINTLNKF